MIQQLRQLAAAFGLLTRLPVWRLVPDAPADFAASVWAYPLVGAVIGALGGGVYALGWWLGLTPALAACWTLAATLLITGGLHEDGLTDTADGFGGGRTRERKLEIMRDSRIGSYGALALILSLGLRAAAITALAAPMRVAVALVIAGSMARAAMVLLLATMPPARTDGMAAGLARVPWRAMLPGLATPLILAACFLPIGRMALLAVASAGVALGMRHLAQRQIGGHTGDVLGATAIITECVVLSLAS